MTPEPPLAAPPLAPAFRTALDAAAARGEAGAGSDVDLYAVTDADTSGHLGRVVGAVPVEVSFGCAVQWRALLERERPAVVHAFATGRTLWDRTGGALAGAACVRDAVEAACAEAACAEAGFPARAAVAVDDAALATLGGRVGAYDTTAPDGARPVR